MNSFDLTRLCIAVALILSGITFGASKNFKGFRKINTKTIARVAVFAAFSIILYIVPVFKFRLPIFPAFLEIHLDEIPALIAGFAYGPLSGVAVILIKTLVKLPLTSTLGVGELADLLYSLAFIIPASIVYKRIRRIKGALIGLSIGVLVQVVFSSFFTSFVMLDFYGYVFGMSQEVILNMCKAVNPNIDSLGFTFLFLIALPFNALKDLMVVVTTFILYKRLHKLIDRINK